MKKLVVLLMVSLMATSAFAVIDPDPNMMGIYFDLDANQLELDATANTPFMAHFMLTNSSYPEISGFECTYSFVTPAGFEGLVFNLGLNVYGGLNIGTAGATYGNLVVGYPSPRAATPALPLASVTMMLLGEFRVEGYLGAAEIPSLPGGLPVIEIGGDLRTVGLSTGGTDTPVCIINPTVDDEPVAEEVESFGGVKALFR
jgi:hypothetical protein